MCNSSESLLSIGIKVVCVYIYIRVYIYKQFCMDIGSHIDFGECFKKTVNFSGWVLTILVLT